MNKATLCLLAGLSLSIACSENQTKEETPELATEHSESLRKNINVILNEINTEQEKIDYILNVINQRYGIKVFYDSIDMDFLREAGFTNADIVEKQDAVKILGEIYQDLQKYPDFMMRKYGPSEFYIVKELNDEHNIDIGGYAGQGGDKLFLNTKGDFYWALEHELFHVFDQKSPWNRDLSPWLLATSFCSDTLRDQYEDETVSDYLKYLRSCYIRSHLSAYGKIFEQDTSIYRHAEDKAVFGERIMDGYDLKHALELAKADNQIRIKIELITGCKIGIGFLYGDEDPYFERLLAFEEYKGLVTDTEGNIAGLDNFDYYRKWSTDSSGKVWMDSDYYNQMLKKSYIKTYYWDDK